MQLPRTEAEVQGWRAEMFAVSAGDGGPISLHRGTHGLFVSVATNAVLQGQAAEREWRRKEAEEDGDDKKKEIKKAGESEEEGVDEALLEWAVRVEMCA